MNQDHQLPHSSPEAQGIASSAIRAFVDEAEQQIRSLHSFMLLRRGCVVAQGWWSPYTPEDPHMLFSLSKSFTATAVGLAIEEGRLSLDDLVLDFFPGDVPAQPGEHLRTMRVCHLLSMSTGHAEDTLRYLHEAPDGNWARAFLARPVEYAPGTHFLYNTGATYMLSAIVQRLADMRMLDYLQSRLFQPLGIEDPAWETSPQGIDTGGWGLSIRTEDIARFGQLYLQKGLWQDRRILPEAWVEQATARQISNGSDADSDWAQGYGYQFWCCRHGAYRGDGAFGQFCMVMPEQQAVLAITAGVSDMQVVLNLVWKHLLPAMGPEPLPEGSAAAEALRRKLASLALPPQPGADSSAVTGRVSGKQYALDANPEQITSARFDFDDAGCRFTLNDGRGAREIRCGSGAWVKGETSLENDEPRRVAASGAWTDEETFAMRLWFYETPFEIAISCRFVGDRVAIDRKMNVAFGPTERPRLEGGMG